MTNKISSVSLFFKEVLSLGHTTQEEGQTLWCGVLCPRLMDLTPRGAGAERPAEGGGCRAEGRPASELPLVGERPEVAVASRCELRALTNFATLKNGGCVVAPSAVTEAAGEENPPQTQSWDCWGVFQPRAGDPLPA